MAVGDFVSGVFVTAGISTFQPASGVTIMITQAYSYNQFISITNGTIIADTLANNSSGNATTFKLFITNSIYLYLPVSGNSGKMYCGVQVA